MLGGTRFCASAAEQELGPPLWTANVFPCRICRIVFYHELPCMKTPTAVGDALIPRPELTGEEVIERHDGLNIKRIRIALDAIGRDKRQMNSIRRTGFLKKRIPPSA